MKLIDEVIIFNDDTEIRFLVCKLHNSSVIQSMTSSIVITSQGVSVVLTSNSFYAWNSRYWGGGVYTLPMYALKKGVGSKGYRHSWKSLGSGINFSIFYHFRPFFTRFHPTTIAFLLNKKNLQRSEI